MAVSKAKVAAVDCLCSLHENTHVPQVVLRGMKHKLWDLAELSHLSRIDLAGSGQPSRPLTVRRQTKYTGNRVRQV